MLDMNQSAMLRYPVKEFLIILCLILLALLIFTLLKDWKRSPEKPRRNRLLAVSMALLLVPCVVFLGIYEEPEYNFPSRFDMEMDMTNSSSDVGMGDIWVSIDDAQASIYLWENTTSIYGLIPGNFYELTLTCNETPVFDGLNSVTLNVYYKWERMVVYYTNATGGIIMKMPEGGYPSPVHLAFSNGESYAEFDVWASEICY